MDQPQEQKALETQPSTEARIVSENNQGGGQSSSKGNNAGEFSSTSSSKAVVVVVVVDGEGSSSKTLEHASELMEKGSLAMKAGDFSEAVDCFSRAVEIRVASFGELAPDCSNAYYKYGCALLYKAQEEADPLGVVPKKNSDPPQISESEKRIKDESSAASTVITDDTKDGGDSVHNKGELDGEREGASEKDQGEEDDGDDNDEGSEGEDVADQDQDEDDSDLDLAWKMLDVARAIVEKNPNDTMEKVDILSALGEVALEREDIETSLSDYMNALSILERLVEPDSRQIAELNFRICLVLEVGTRTEEAVPYCQKAISVCKARLQRMRDEVKNSASTGVVSVTDQNVDPAAVVESHSNSSSSDKEAEIKARLLQMRDEVKNSASTGVVSVTDQNVDPAAVVESGSNSSSSDKEAEIKDLSGLASELEKKLEDLQQQSLQPNSIFADVLKMISARSTGGEKGVPSTILSSSQMGINNNSSGDLNSSTASTAHTNGNSGVTHLGVVGRGVKRVLMNPTESSTAKKPLLDPSMEKGDGSCS